MRQTQDIGKKCFSVLYLARWGCLENFFEEDPQDPCNCRSRPLTLHNGLNGDVLLEYAEKILKRSIRRYVERYPWDFMFERPKDVARERLQDVDRQGLGHNIKNYTGMSILRLLEILRTSWRG